MSKIQIAIADDHQLFREGLSTIIQIEANFHVIIEAENGQDLLDALQNLEESTHPDVVLLDLKMPTLDGIGTAEKIRAEYPSIKIIVLTMHHQEDFILHMLKLGVNAYLFKNSSSQEVRKAIKAVVERDYYFDDHISQVMLQGLRRKKVIKPKINDDVRITPRETEVLDLICREYTNTEIADKLFISNRTVETHRKNLLEKLGVKNTAGLVIKAVAHNFFQLSEY